MVLLRDADPLARTDLPSHPTILLPAQSDCEPPPNLASILRLHYSLDHSSLKVGSLSARRGHACRCLVGWPRHQQGTSSGLVARYSRMPRWTCPLHFGDLRSSARVGQPEPPRFSGGRAMCHKQVRRSRVAPRKGSLNETRYPTDDRYGGSPAVCRRSAGTSQSRCRLSWCLAPRRPERSCRG